jgi:4-hydroxybenzoate polyprenyltransferase
VEEESIPQPSQAPGTTYVPPQPRAPAPAHAAEHARYPIDEPMALRLGSPLGAATRVRDLIQLCRPKDWVKNVFVLIPFLFTTSLYHVSSYGTMALAVGCFCLWSSAVYFVNDLLDADMDRQHPRKCQRPIAAGRVRPELAVAMAVLLALQAALLAYLFLPSAFLGIGGLYLANSLAYCLVLKHKVIVDVLLIAIGFVLRLLAGCVAIACQPSSWILICGFSLALVLGFGKRRAEVACLSQRREFRPALECYDNAKLDVLLAICCSICMLSYILYTVAAETIAFHGTRQLIYTIPFVIYGLFRFVFKVQEGKGDGPTEILLGDPIFLMNGLMWSLAVVVILNLK